MYTNQTIPTLLFYHIPVYLNIHAYARPILPSCHPAPLLTVLRLITRPSVLPCTAHVSIFTSINNDGCLEENRSLSSTMFSRINGMTNGGRKVQGLGNS